MADQSLKVVEKGRFSTVGINRARYVDARVLAAGVAEVHTVPTGYNYVNFSADGNFYANFGAAAAIPSADVTDGTGSVLNPTFKSLESATTIGLVAATATVVTMEFWK
jgi:hypothetical protein